MPKIVSSSEAKSRFGSMLRWTKENKDEVVIQVHGEPEGVLMSYEEYQKVEVLRKRARKREALEALKELRREVRSRTPDLTEEEAYKLSGFSEEAASRLVEKDREISSERPG
jgi:prevent-host-death family protein